jgi:hypothetical protein
MKLRIAALAACLASMPGVAQERWTFGDIAVELPPLPALASVSEIADVFVSREIGSGRIVKGAPYSAEAISETTQTLADGNRIVRRSTSKLARDAAGRTRQERADGSVFINDPVAGKRYVLTSNRTALELPLSHAPRMPAPAPRAPGAGPGTTPAPGATPAVPPAPPVAPVPPSSMSPEEARSWAEEMRNWARDLRERMRADPIRADAQREGVVVRDDTRVITARAAAPVADGAPGASPGREVRDVRVEVVELGGPQARIPPMPPIPWTAPLAPGLLDALPLVGPVPGGRDAGVQTSLGSRSFDGVRADGSRTTWTIPAGRIGNEKPIEIVSERWYAPELMVVVATRYADPRSGETTYRLANLKRDEPAADQFRVPDGYTLRGARDRDKERKERHEQRREQK